MYAVIRTGGRQYRVAPGDIIRVEKLGGADNTVQFEEILAVSGEEGKVGRPEGEARVTGQVVGEGRGDKILVFHYKRKKQYKKLAGHRQPFTAVRITEIAFDGQTFKAPDLPEKKVKPPKAEAAAETAEETAAPKKKKKLKAKAHGESKAHHAAKAHRAAKKAHPAKKGKKK